MTFHGWIGIMVSGRRNDMVKIYVMDTTCLGEPGIFEKAQKELSGARLEKVKKAHGEENKKQELAAGLLLVHGLRSYGIDAAMQEFAIGKNGKPHLKDRPDIHFNLTHSGMYAAAAFSDTEVGIDLEHKCHNIEKIAERFFTKQEAEAITSCMDEKEKQTLFLRYWTLKESVLKITGQGMYLSMQDFAFSLGAEVQMDWVSSDEQYFFREFEIRGKDAIMGEVQYRLAVCAGEKEFWDYPQFVEYPWENRKNGE